MASKPLTDLAKPSPVELVVANPWAQLRQFTPARIALGRTGVSLPTQPQLAFQLAHAKARDAVHELLDAMALEQSLKAAGLARSGCIQLHSAAPDRQTYLQRPDLGRRLSDASRAELTALATGFDPGGYDLALVIADGLSAQAVAAQAVPLLSEFLPLVHADGLTLAPLTVARMGRVALADEVGALLRARVVVILIGERPGLSAFDSMGIYATWAPQVGSSDAQRNCISNVRPAGLGSVAAAAKLHYLVSEMHRRQLSGVPLKDETTDEGSLGASPQRHFLVGSDPTM